MPRIETRSYPQARRPAKPLSTRRPCHAITDSHGVLFSPVFSTSRPRSVLTAAAGCESSPPSPILDPSAHTSREPGTPPRSRSSLPPEHHRKRNGTSKSKYSTLKSSSKQSPKAPVRPRPGPKRSPSIFVRPLNHTKHHCFPPQTNRPIFCLPSQPTCPLRHQPVIDAKATAYAGKEPRPQPE